MSWLFCWPANEKGVKREIHQDFPKQKLPLFTSSPFVQITDCICQIENVFVQITNCICQIENVLGWQANEKGRCKR